VPEITSRAKQPQPLAAFQKHFLKLAILLSKKWAVPFPGKERHYKWEEGDWGKKVLSLVNLGGTHGTLATLSSNSHRSRGEKRK
jgi:hypothetical protein